MIFHTMNRNTIETELLPGPSAVVCMADSESQLAKIKDMANAYGILRMVFDDATRPFGIVKPPSKREAATILNFFRLHRNTPHFVAQCQAGVGRSHAVVAALSEVCAHTRDHANPILRNGSYNRLLYRFLLEEAGIKPPEEPLVSIVVRVKYAPDRIISFIDSMRHQRYENWEVVAVTDGPNPQTKKVANCFNLSFGGKKVRVVQTPVAKGRWGHPYRQLGIDAAKGRYIGLQNDDNYLSPGFVEQLVFALEEGADIALCQCLHNYDGYQVREPGADLGCWLARADLVRRVPWTGIEFDSDIRYIEALKGLVPIHRVKYVQRVLYVHN